MPVRIELSSSVPSLVGLSPVQSSPAIVYVPAGPNKAVMQVLRDKYI